MTKEQEREELHRTIWKMVDNPEHTHPLSGAKSRIQKERDFFK